MTPEKLEENLLKVAEIQRNAGWSEHSIGLYADEQRKFHEGSPDCVILIGAGLACDNTRFGVPNPGSPAVEAQPGSLPQQDDQAKELEMLRAILKEVYLDSGFRNLHEPLQDRIADIV